MPKLVTFKIQMLLFALIISILTPVSVASEDDNLLSFPKPKIYSYKKMIYNQPIVLFNDEQEVENITYTHFTKHGEVFNYVPYLFFTHNTEKLIGFNDTETLFPNTLKISERFEEYQNLRNPITKRKRKKELIDYIQSSHTKANYTDIYQKEYYSDLRIKKVRNYNSTYNRQNIIFDNNSLHSNIQLVCKKNGQKYAYVNPKISKYGKFTFDSYTLNTPIYLEIPDELKNNLTHFNNTKNKPFCEYNKEFKDIDKAEKYINYINNSRNRFIIRFALNKNHNQTTYLSGHVTYFGLTTYDGINNNRVFTSITSNSNNYDKEKDVLYELAKENLASTLKDIKQEQITATGFLDGHYAYKIGVNYYFKVNNKKDKALIFNISNRFLGEYDLAFTGKEIKLTFSKIIREHDYYFPREVLIYKENKEKYHYTSNILFNLKDEFIALETDMQNNLVFDFEKLIKIP
jgi:hypothetical protein